MNRPDKEHIHKNLWLVRNANGLQEAAKVVAHQNNSTSLPVTVISNRMQLSDKYPCIVVLIQVDCAMVEVISVITDTTLRHCLRELAS